MRADAAVRLLADSPPRRVVVLQTAYLGDVVFTAPLVRALKRRWPGAQLTLVVAPRGAEIARHIPGVDTVVVHDKRGAERSLASVWRLGRQLECDLVVAPHTSGRTALLAASIPARLRVGPRTALGMLVHDVTAPWVEGAPFVERMLGLVRVLGAEATPDLHLRVRDDARQAARARLGSGRFVGAVVGSEWETKRLPAAIWAAWLDGLCAQGLTPVLLGGPKEQALAEAIRAASKAPERWRSTVGNSIGEALAELACCSLVLGGDTGLVHAARGLGVPTVTFFGPTDPKRHRFEGSTTLVARSDLPCMPCHAHGPRVCPLGHHACLSQLPLEQLVAAAADRLEVPFDDPSGPIRRPSLTQL